MQAWLLLEVHAMTSRRKSIGRGDEASGPVMSTRASQSMARGESVEKIDNPEHGTPEVGKYTRYNGGVYGK